MAAVLIIYTVLSTQVFYGGLVENRKESLKVYMNLFDAGEYAWDDVRRKCVFSKPFGASCHVYGPGGKRAR